MADPNTTRKNKFEAKVERDSFQDTFVPYFDPTDYGEFDKTNFKFISSNFNSKMNFAITEHNEVCQFGSEHSGKRVKF